MFFTPGAAEFTLLIEFLVYFTCWDLWDKFVIVSRQHTDVKSALLFACSLLKSVFWISLSDDEWSGELCWRASQWGQTVAHPGASVDHPNTESVQDIKYVHTQITHFSEGGEGKSW